MAVIIEMPKLSDTMTAGTVIAWLKKEGEAVEPGDILAEIETDKATMELESFEEGVLLARYVEEGREVAISAPICAIGQAGEEAPAVPHSGEPAERPAKPEAAAQRDNAPPDVAVAPPAEAAAVAAATPPTSGAVAGRIKASPLARKIAADHEIDLQGILGSGPGGRIVKVDVMAAVAKTREPAKAQASTGPAGLAAETASLDLIAPEASLPVSNMRGVIARRLLESKSTIPHIYLEIEVEMGPLLDMRASVNANLTQLEEAQGGIRLTVNDLILKASAQALRRVPAVNRSWEGTAIRQFGGVHLAFAVAIDDGLVTPVIFNAHSKSIRQISTEAGALAAKAKNRKLKPEEMSGSTFTVSNLGMMGVTRFFGIINPPNAALLSVGATVKRPVVDGEENIVVGRRMTLGLSADHRVIDGAVGARFLSALKEIIETPALILV